VWIADLLRYTSFAFVALIFCGLAQPSLFVLRADCKAAGQLLSMALSAREPAVLQNAELSSLLA